MTRFYIGHISFYLAFNTQQTATVIIAVNFLLNLNHLVLLYFRTSIITIVFTSAYGEATTKISIVTNSQNSLNGIHFMIRVIIERHIAHTLETTYEQAAKNTLQQAVSADGFISGESLRNANDPNHRLILSNWRSIQDWHRWFLSEERKEMMNILNPILETEEKVTILEQA